MHLIVTLPPKAEQEMLVDRWVDVLLGESTFDQFEALVAQCLKAGFSIHGITCLLLHDSTVQSTLRRVRGAENIQLEAAYGKSICLN